MHVVRHRTPKEVQETKRPVCNDLARLGVEVYALEDEPPCVIFRCRSRQKAQLPIGPFQFRQVKETIQAAPYHLERDRLFDGGETKGQLADGQRIGESLEPRAGIEPAT